MSKIKNFWSIVVFNNDRNNVNNNLVFFKEESELFRFICN